MSDDVVKLEVDGETVEARPGQMLIEVTDRIGAYVPRFCYHEKLTVAANCRMCLVEVEKAPKPLPACATPVGEGMKVFTRSPYAIAAQKATMEFLLINHPLDCPICDQGGECELQDIAMGFGRDVSRYAERKRVVKDKDIGPLVSTDMTRCIHCTRCVRFGEEISGVPELGTTERGEHMQIGTYIEKSIDHELSANIIDLCPVGALNNKPYRYSARAWEMVQRPTIAAHDCVGSNLFAHVLRGTIKRVVPRDNEDINETWISDRDRFSYEGIYHADRLQSPRLKENGEWRDIDWKTALNELAERMKTVAGNRVGILSSPSATLEEGHLLARLAEHAGSTNLDHRLRRQDFSDQDNDPAAPWLGANIAELESADALLVAGSDIRREAPILAHRIRKAALGGASVSFIGGNQRDYFFAVAAQLAGDMSGDLAGVAAALGNKLPPSVKKLCAGVKPTDKHQRIAGALADGKNAIVLLGLEASRRADYAALRALAAAIAAETGAQFGYVSEGANSVGLSLAGVLPHRSANGVARAVSGHHAVEMAAGNLELMLLFGVEPGVDMPALSAASHRFVAALTPYRSRALEHCADLLLPIGTFAETSGTFVNCENRWQSFAGVANPVGEARPGWKVLRVLGNLLDAPGFDYESSEEVRDELHKELDGRSVDTGFAGNAAIPEPATDTGNMQLDVPMYAVDGVVRRARALQLTPEAERGRDAVA